MQLGPMDTTSDDMHIQDAYSEGVCSPSAFAPTAFPHFHTALEQQPQQRKRARSNSGLSPDGWTQQQPALPHVFPASVLFPKRPCATTAAGSPRAVQSRQITSSARPGKFRGVTKHRHTQRFEAHLWDSEAPRQTKAGGKGRTRGKQVYLGGFATEEEAARAYDRAALVYWGDSAQLNYRLSDYQHELPTLEAMTREDIISTLRRGSSGFARGQSRFRGVTRHHQQGKWEARIGRAKGENYMYLGVFDSEVEAAIAYDHAALSFKKHKAVTNFASWRYIDSTTGQLKDKDDLCISSFPDQAEASIDNPFASTNSGGSSSGGGASPLARLQDRPSVASLTQPQQAQVPPVRLPTLDLTVPPAPWQLPAVPSLPTGRHHSHHLALPPPTPLPQQLPSVAVPPPQTPPPPRAARISSGGATLLDMQDDCWDDIMDMLVQHTHALDDLQLDPYTSPVPSAPGSLPSLRQPWGVTATPSAGDSGWKLPVGTQQPAPAGTFKAPATEPATVRCTVPDWIPTDLLSELGA